MGSQGVFIFDLKKRQFEHELCFEGNIYLTLNLKKYKGVRQVNLPW